MVKKFTVSCDFAGKKIPVTFFVGNAAIGSHPIGFQSNWLGKEKGGVVPEKLMNSLMQLKEIADKNKVSFEDLCTYVIDEVNSAGEVVKNLENNQQNEQKK
jgi:hypothetical protein